MSNVAGDLAGQRASMQWPVLKVEKKLRDQKLCMEAASYIGRDAHTSSP
jgi:hypothetical protein